MALTKLNYSHYAVHWYLMVSVTLNPASHCIVTDGLRSFQSTIRPFSLAAHDRMSAQDTALMFGYVEESGLGVMAGTRQ